MSKILKALLWMMLAIVSSIHAMEMEEIEINRPSSFESSSARKKIEILWKQIKDSKFDTTQLPAILGPGVSGFFNLMSANFLSKAFSHDTDVMISNRCKHIHTRGTVVKVSFIAEYNEEHNFTGILATGAEYGLLRLSLAGPPQDGKYVPGIALKLFRDGLPSVNTMAMHSLDGQESSNLFENDFTTVLPTPEWSLTSCLLQWRFTAALSEIGQVHGNPLALSSGYFAASDENGIEDDHATAPYQLIFRPTKDAQKLMPKDSIVDFRQILENNGKNIVLYEVYGRTSPTIENDIYLGYIKTNSNFHASSFGDEKLYFQHPTTHTSFAL